MARALAAVALAAACGGGGPAASEDFAVPPDFATVGASDFSTGADLSGGCGVADLGGGCSAPIGGSDSCCGGTHCNGARACASACGFANATCASSADCCYNLWCDPAGTHCRGCLGAGRQAAGQPCPGGNGDCCSDSCGGNGRCAL
jgi:hypothetical protein